MRITSSSHSVARCERLRAARDGLSVPWCEEPGAARARGQVSRGELRRSVVTMMVMPRSLHRCCGRERQREHCRRHMAAAICASWRSSLRWIRNERTLRSSFTSRLNLVAGDRVPGSLIHLALQCGRAVSFASVSCPQAERQMRSRWADQPRAERPKTRRLCGSVPSTRLLPLGGRKR